MSILAARLGVPADELEYASLFVLGRYAAQSSGHSNADSRAVWSDWGHFERENSSSNSYGWRNLRKPYANYA